MLGLINTECALKMNGFVKYSLLLIILSYAALSAAQVRDPADSTIRKWKEYFDLSYGLDYNLINGVKYLNLYPNSNGHPFFAEDQFTSGRLLINEWEYQDVFFKYDIHNQHIVLRYSPFPGGTDQIILNNEFIDEFQIDDKLFRKYSFSETGTRFFQVVTSGKINCLFYWEKDLNYSHNSLDYYNQFSPQTRQAYLIMNGDAYPFNNRRSFLKLYPANYHKEIVQFIRSNNIQVKQGTENNIRQLVNFCNQLVENI